MSKRGFTIVELLIVIVVLSILTGIAIVGFSGIQKRAVATQAGEAMSSADKIIRLYAAANSSLPEDTCLGSISNYPATAVFANGECNVQVRNGTKLATFAQYSSTVSDALSASGSVKSITTPWPVAIETFGSDFLHSRGMHWNKMNETRGLILYVLQGDFPCPSASSRNYYGPPDNTTYCYKEILI